MQRYKAYQAITSRFLWALMAKGGFWGTAWWGAEAARDLYKQLQCRVFPDYTHELVRTSWAAYPACPVQLQRRIRSPSLSWLGWVLPTGCLRGWLQAGGLSTMQRGQGPSQHRSPTGCNDLMGTTLPGLLLNVCARGNLIFSIHFQSLTVRVIQLLHRPLVSTRAAQRNKWFLLEVVESLPQNSFLSANAHLLSLKRSMGW